MWGISYWAIPLFSSVVWLAMLLAMILSWITDGKPHYPSMGPTQDIAFISDVGAQRLKPLFIAMSAVSVVSLDIAFLSERWLRHSGRLARNTSWWQKSYSILSIIAAIVGAAGIILLSIFDTWRHPRLHDVFLGLFIGGYVISAIFICLEYQRLGVHHREHTIIQISFWMKVTFIIVELALAIGFGVMRQTDHWNTAAILEWIVALVFTFYVLSFFVDFIPAVRTKNHQSRETEVEMAMEGPETTSETGLYPDGAGANVYPTSNAFTNQDPNRYQPNGFAAHPNTRGINGNTYYADGHPDALKPANGRVPLTSNF
ncbi:uncharacterized protein K452DRAFT_228016 [Aplosporella prunicola CBS 121167]|uniref:CWH43-like N-terminal domain-containing protein n=1 Tax=Aplosporella prunicola CBS 121167 TaxID=1176127 RepID=A0A6A6BEQ9_9PEZI|nr:uncharacterized protein K452DRAFT_228016 [Aplosporella prunicola CBS 121167]KAF2141795.1 hypothetical protein K452DRAFT_228016 [Aplosporella prunicola CBS 121167]